MRVMATAPTKKQPIKADDETWAMTTPNTYEDSICYRGPKVNLAC